MFRKIVGANAWRYRLGDTHRVKQDLVRQIIEWVRYEQDPPGRFLKKDKNDGAWRVVGDEEALFNDYDDAWRVVGDKEALKKTRQELREYSDLYRKKHYLDKNVQTQVKEQIQVLLSVKQCP